MAHIRLLHWNAEEAACDLEMLRRAGHAVDYEAVFRPGMLRAWRESPPDAFVINLSRLPSHGREIAIQLRQSRVTRNIPLVFYEGAAEKLRRIQAELPDAVYASRSKLKSAVRSALANPVANPVIPVQMMNRYASRTAAQKLGIKEGTAVAVINAPARIAAVLGELPKGVSLAEDMETPAPVTLCFIHDVHSLKTELSHLRNLADKTKLWAIWQKRAHKMRSADEGVSENLIREIGISLGLVDYKICSVDQAWSGMLFARKRSPTAHGPRT